MDYQTLVSQGDAVVRGDRQDLCLLAADAHHLMAVGAECGFDHPELVGPDTRGNAGAASQPGRSCRNSM